MTGQGEFGDVMRRDVTSLSGESKGTAGHFCFPAVKEVSLYQILLKLMLHFSGGLTTMTHPAKGQKETIKQKQLYK